MRVFRNPWDAVPAALAIIHFALLIALFLAWPLMSWPARVAGGALYAFSIGWSLDSIAHNFIHNEFFSPEWLNTAMSFVISWTLGISQVMHEHIHWLHHAGNSDRPKPGSTTIDPISIYKFGGGGRAEPVLPYVFLAFLRDDDPFTLARDIAAKRPEAARQALVEFWSLMAFWALLLLFHWSFVLVMAPFYYLGHCFSALIAYYEHLGADPDRPTAMGVSTYAPIYNFLFLNNGYHAEHHFRPKHHWTKMERLRATLSAEGKLAGVRTLRTAHFLGFLEESSWMIPTSKRV